MRKTTKLLALALSLLMIFSLLTACVTTPPVEEEPEEKPAEQPAEEKPAEEKPAEEAPAELEGDIFMFMSVNDFPEIIETWANGFMAENPKVSVDVQMMTGATLNENLVTRVASDDLPDVFSGNMSEFFSDLADKDMLADVSDIKCWDDMLDNLKPLWTSPKGKAFGVSSGVATTLIYYNVDMFKAAGITELPANWDEFLAACDKLVAAGETPFVWTGGDTNMLAHGPFIWGLGNDVVRDIGTNFNSMILTEKYDFANWDKIYEKIVTLESRGYFPEDHMAITQQNGPQIFAEGGGAMYMGGSWNSAAFFAVEGFEVGCMAPPWNAAGDGLIGVLGTESGAVIGQNDNVELSKALLDYMYNEHFDEWQNKRQGIPPFKADQGWILDDRILAYVDEMGKCEMTVGIAGHILPAAVLAESIKLCQDVLLGTDPSTIPATLTAIQAEYIDSKS